MQNTFLAVLSLRRNAFASRVLLALWLCFAGLAHAAEPQRVVAVGDVHGDFAALSRILQKAELVDKDLRWTGGKAVLVQTGDILDRGPHDAKVMDLLMDLQQQAERAGGRVVVLLGNHEAMNLMGDLRYVSAEVYASFADAQSEQRREQAWKKYSDWHQVRFGQQPTDTDREAWHNQVPLGYLEHREAMAPNGRYGKWLRKLPAMARVGDTVFLHGGLHPNLKMRLDGINDRVQREVQAFDQMRDELARQQLVLPYFTFQQVMEAAESELKRLASTPADLETERGQALRRALDSAAQSKTWLSLNPDGPLWFRGFAEWSEQEGEAHVPALKKRHRAARFVVGHTVQRDQQINPRFGNSVYLIDTGMLASHYKGRPSALEIRPERVTALYETEQVVLFERANTTSAGSLPDAATAALGGGDERAAAASTQVTAAAPVLPRTWLAADGTPMPFRNDAEVISFLESAKVVSIRDLGEGVTVPRKLVLEKDGLRMHAIFRDVDIERISNQTRTGVTELFFRDNYNFEPAAYRLSLLLGLDNVPPATLRRLRGKSGSIQIWVENANTETNRRKQKLEPPEPERWAKQYHVMHVFDALIYNTDRNTGNFLADAGWKLWMIDHTRAFRIADWLQEPDKLVRCERRLLARLQQLDEPTLKRELGRLLRSQEIKGLLKRRDAIVAHFNKLVAERGEAAVLYDMD